VTRRRSSSSRLPTTHSANRARALYDADLARGTPQAAAPPPAAPRTRVHRYGTPPPVGLRPPSSAVCQLALGLAATALVALILPTALAVEHRLGAALLSLPLAVALGSTARTRAVAELDRIWRFGTLWAYGFALSEPGAEADAHRCRRLATSAEICAKLVPRLALVSLLLGLVALAPR